MKDNLSPIQLKALEELQSLGVDKSFALSEVQAKAEDLLLRYDQTIEAIYLDHRAGLAI